MHSPSDCWIFEQKQFTFLQVRGQAIGTDGSLVHPGRICRQYLSYSSRGIRPHRESRFPLNPRPV